MAFKYILLISLAIALGSTEEGKRLIKYDIKEPAKWMTSEEISQLIEKTDGYMDLTREGVDITMTGAEAEGRQNVEYKYPDGPNQKETVYKLLSSLQKDNLEAHVRKLSAFHSRKSRHYFGESEAEGWLISEIKRQLMDYKGGRYSISIQLVGDSDKETGDYVRYKQHSIILKLQGHDPNWLDELVILGAHYDTRSNNDTVPTVKLPGADDNASGCAVLLETLRLVVQSGILLKHTVEFHFYTAKELGMLGSQHVVAKYEKEERKVKGMLNFDRVGYGNTIVVTNKSVSVNGPLTKFVNTLVKEYTQNVAISEKNVFTGSDQLSWHNKRYPSAYLLELGTSPYIHSEKDTIETVNFELVSQFTKVAVAFVIELGEPTIIPSAAKPGQELLKMELILIWCGILYFLN